MLLKNYPCFWEGKGKGILQLEKFLQKLLGEFFAFFSKSGPEEYSNT
jgi:hypothetical protein